MIDEITIKSLAGRGTLFLKSREYFGYWLGAVDWGRVEGQHQTYNYYKQVGKRIVGTTIGTRALSITGWVIDGAGQIQDRCDFLNAFISPVEDYDLEYKGKKIQFRPDISVAYSPEYVKNNEKVRRFLIQGTCPFPLFSDKADTAVPFQQTGNRFRFPTDFGQLEPLVFAVSGQSCSVRVNNRGGFSTGFIVRIRFSGQVENPKIRNLTTGDMVGVNRTFARGEQLELSTIPGNKHITLWTENGQKVNLMKYRDVRSSFDTQLQPGENHIALECADPDQRPAMDVTLYYTPLYLEVE